MRRNILSGLTSLLVPFAAYGASTYGAYQRKQLARATSEQLIPSTVPSPAKPRLMEATADTLSIMSGAPVSELIIIDAAVPDKTVLRSAAKPGVETVVLEDGKDALEQVAVLLENYQDLEAVHLISHGDAGAILLGDQRIDQTILESQPRFLAALNSATRTGADLLLYGCDLAKDGTELLELIQQNSHLDVAASNNLTGASELGGDWTLEVQVGSIEVTQPFSSKALQDFSSVLRPFGTKTFESWNGESYQDDPIRDWDDFTTYISTPGAYDELLSGTVCNDDLYVSMYDPTSQFFIRSYPAGENFGVTGLTIRAPDNGGFPADQVSIYGYEDGNPTPIASKTNVSVAATATPIDLTSGITGSFAEIRRIKIHADNLANNEVDFCLMSVAFTPLDTDGSLTAAGGVTEPVGLDTTVDTVGEAVDVFDFTLSDGGTSDGQAMDISQIVVNVSGTSTDPERGQITWRLNGSDVSNASGTYNAGSDSITFSGLNISVADGDNETYTVNAYYNDNSNLTEDRTIILAVDGDTDLTVGADGTQMGSTTAVTNSTGTTIDVVSAALAFSTQPAGSVSGAALSTQPVVAARDAFGNTDVDFTETITLTEGSAGTPTNNTQAATNGVATFTNFIYTATADQESFTLTANDQDGVGSNLPTVNANAVTSDVVATQLVFDTQPAPTTLNSGVSTNFTTVPVVSATDANDTVDTGYSTDITLAEVNGAGSATMTATGDTDGNGSSVTITPSSGVSTFTGMDITYTASGGSNETFNLRASSGGLTTADSNQLTAIVNNAPTDIALSANTINQSSTAAAAAVGTLSTTDADGGDSHTYSLVNNGASGNGSCGSAGDDDNASFQIDNVNDELETAGSLTGGSYSVCIQTSDGAASYQESFMITVTDDVVPTVSSVSVPANATYITGQNLDFTVNTNENVTVNTTGGTPQIALTVGATTRQATYLSGSGTSAIVFRYTVQAGDSDTDGIAVAASVNSNGGTLQDGSGNNLNTTLNSVGSTASVLVDAVAPTVSSVGAPANATYVAGQNLDFTINTNENVTVNTTGGTPQLSLTIGAATRQAFYLSGSGTSALVFRYTVQSGDLDTDGIAVGSLSANGGTLRDGAGNNLNTTLNSVGSTTSVRVDAAAPTVSSVSVPSNATYVAGQNLDFTINTDENVTVNTGGGTPRIALTIGATTRYATYLSGSGTSALVFRYTIQSGDNDSDGIAVAAVMDANSGTLRDGAGNDLNSTLNSVGATTSVLVDAVAPTTSSVSVPANGTYNAGQNLDFTVNTSENITVNTGGGTPRIALTIGATTRQATYLSGSGTSALVFRYTVQAGDNDADGIAVAASIDANGGTLRDGAGNGLNTTLNSVADTSGVLVDTIAPAPTIGSAAGDPVNGAFSATVDFGESVDGFVVGDITAGNASLSAFTDNNDGSFTVTVTPTTHGTVSLDVAANVAQDAGGNNNIAATSFSIDYDDPNLDSDGDGIPDNVELANGLDPNDPSDADQDADGDGVSNLDEYIADTDLLADDYPPEFAGALADVAINATGLLTTRANLDVPVAVDGLDGNIEATVTNVGNWLRPGLYSLTWTATDAAGNSAQEVQNLRVRPLISLSKDQQRGEGTSARVRVLLNGEAPDYPFSVGYTVAGSADGADHDLVAGTVTFTAGQVEQEITVNIVDDVLVEGTETLIVTLDEATTTADQANFGSKQIHEIRIVEHNVAPTVQLSVQQDGREARTVVKDGSPVTITATVDDPNPGDTHTYDWALPDTVFTDPSEDVRILDASDPNALVPGVYSAAVTVEEENGSPLSSGNSVLFRVIATAPILDAGTDSDGDGIDDATEGFGDSDGDGIPDYLDGIPLANVLNQNAADGNRFLIEADPGLRIGLGQWALRDGSDGAQIGASVVGAADGIPADTLGNTGGYVDLIVRGLPSPGASVNIVIPQQQAIPAQPVYRKFADGQWFTFVENANNNLASAPGQEGFCPPPGSNAYSDGMTPGHWCVQMTIEDGGPNDDDGVANGAITDPGGVGTAIPDSTSAPGPVMHQTRSGGGGGAVGLPMLFALLLIVGWRAKRARHGVATLAVLVLLLPGQTNAQGSADGDWWRSVYITGGGSLANTPVSKGDLQADFAKRGIDAQVHSLDTRRIAWTLGAGFAIDRNWSVEVAYRDLGDVDLNFTTANTANLASVHPESGAGWSLSGLYRHPLSADLGLQARLGLFNWKQDFQTYRNAAQVDEYSDSGTELSWGFGLNYRLEKHITVSGEVERVEFDREPTLLFSLGAQWWFE
ncbi:MAG: DUF4347 domain-containing protein [Cellvibrionaceae bacterium]